MNQFTLNKLLATSFPRWDKKSNKIEWREKRFSSKNKSLEENCDDYLVYLYQLERKIFEIFSLVRLDYLNYAKFRDRLYHHRQKFIYRSTLVLLLEKNYKEGNII
jgi:hypothetical protein